MAVTTGTLVTGDSGSGKSCLLATLAEWMWQKYKKVSLLYYSDGGGFPTKMDALIRAGIIRAWKIRTRGEAFETCSRACQGYWPIEFLDPLAGETLPGVKLIPSISVSFAIHCNKCKLMLDKQKNRRGFKPMYLCKCGNQVSLQNGIVEEESEVAPFFKDVGAILNDGLTSMNDWIMVDMADKTGRGELKGETAPIGGRIVSGDMIFGGSNRSHYGFAQVRSMQWLQDANNIHGLIIGPVFTARVQRATDTNSNIRVYGPQIAGQAKTADVPAWVGNCIGADIVLDEKGRKEWRLYLTEYREPGDDVLHLCKTRAAPGTMPDFLSDGPVDPNTGKPVSGVEPFTQFNLGYFMELMENATEKTLKETLKAYPDAPGLKYLESMKEVADRVAKESEDEVAEKLEQSRLHLPPKPGGGVSRPVTPTTTQAVPKAAVPGPAGPPKRGPGRPPKSPVPRPGS